MKMKFRTNISVLDQYSSSNISKIAFFLLGIILLSVSSKVSIPFYPVPMTFQTFVVYFIEMSQVLRYRNTASNSGNSGLFICASKKHSCERRKSRIHVILMHKRSQEQRKQRIHNIWMQEHSRNTRNGDFMISPCK